MRRRVLFLVFATLAACSPQASTPSSSGTPSPTPVASPSALGVGHETGATDVILRLSSGGGLMFPEIRALDAPTFTLYGDGTFVAKPAGAPPPPIGGAAPVEPQPAWRTGQLDEAEIQVLIGEAVRLLGPAKARYELNTVMDAPTTTFFAEAEGTAKTVEVYALGMETPDSPDAAVRAQFAAFAEQLSTFGDEGTVESEPYGADAYRAVLIESGPGVGAPARPWPWPELMPDDFTAPADPTGLALPSRTLSDEEFQALGSPAVGGGLTGMYVKAPEGDRVYALALRPLLPDEVA